MTRLKHDPQSDPKTALYRRFLGEPGVETPEFQELFAQEVLTLTHAEQLILKDNDFSVPDRWTEEARAIYTKMLARAAVKAKRSGASKN